MRSGSRRSSANGRPKRRRPPTWLRGARPGSAPTARSGSRTASSPTTSCRARTTSSRSSSSSPTPSTTRSQSRIGHWTTAPTGSPNFSREHYEDMLFTPTAAASYGHPSMRDNYLEISSGRYTVDGSGLEVGAHPRARVRVRRERPAAATGRTTLNGPVYRVVDASGGRCRPRAGIDDRASTGRPSVVDVVGPLRLRRRRQLRRGRRLRRPLPAGARRRGRRGRRRRAGWRRDLEPPLVRRTTAASAPTGPTGCLLGGYQRAGHRSLWVGDYTIEPENGGVGCVRARVRPRPRPAGPV